MRRKITPISLGLRHELYFVCKAEHEDFFQKVCRMLENTYAVKSGVYAYDRDEWSAKVRCHLRRSTYVVLCLTDGAIDAAVSSEEDALRQIIAYLNRRNRDSISLIAIPTYSCTCSAFPKDMNMFEYLHCKSLDPDAVDIEEFAAEMYKELRRTYFGGEQTALADCAVNGLQRHRRVYGLLSKLSIPYLIFTAFFLLVMFDVELPFEYSILFTVLVAFGGLFALFSPYLLLVYTFYQMLMMVDRRGLFSDIKRWFAYRITALALIVPFFNVQKILDWASTFFDNTVQGYQMDHLLVLDLVAFAVSQIVRYIWMAIVLKNKNITFVRFAAHQKLAFLCSGILFVVQALIAEWLYRNGMLILW